MRENIGFCAISNPHRPDKELEAAIPTQNASLGHQITMAQRLKSFKDNFRAALVMGTIRAQHNAIRTRRTDKVPNIDAGSHFARENTVFRAIPNAQTSSY